MQHDNMKPKAKIMVQIIHSTPGKHIGNNFYDKNKTYIWSFKSLPKFHYIASKKNDKKNLPDLLKQRFVTKHLC